MAGAFDTIAAALSGRAQPAQGPAPTPAGKLRGLSDFDTAKAVRARQMQAQGLDPATGEPALRGTTPSTGYAFHAPGTPQTD